MAAAAKIRHNYSNFSNPYPSMDPSVKILVWPWKLDLVSIANWFTKDNLEDLSYFSSINTHFLCEGPQKQMASACKPTDWKHNAPEACTYVAKKLNFGCWLEKQKYDLHALQSKFISTAPALSLHIYLIQLLSFYSSANWLLLPAAKVFYQKRGENTLSRNISCKNWCSYFFHALWQLPKMLRVQ